MAGTTRVKMFVSSLNKYKFGDRTLTEIRHTIKDSVEREFPFFNVLINEELEAQAPGSPKDVTETAARECRLFIGTLVDAYRSPR